MKALKNVLSFLLIAALLLSIGVFAFAETKTYTVRIYPGDNGTIDGSAGVLVISDIPYNSQISFDMARVAANDGSKYYPKGLRVAGEDALAALSFRVTRDMDYVVAYGMKGKMVEYTVNYVDALNGAVLAASQSFFGNVGDKPIVAYKYINGYQPEFYNITGTLQEGVNNVFTFRYNRIVVETPAAPVVPGGNNTPGGAQGGTQGGNVILPGQNGQGGAGTPGGAQSGAQGGTPGGAPGGASGTPEQTPPPPEEILDIDVPLAGPESAPSGESMSRSVPISVILGLLLALLAAIAATAVILSRRKKNN